MRRRTEGFSLIEAIVAIAIMAILAGTMVPLLLKTLNQQRISTTQANLQTAWQVMFGSQGSRVYNMRADFGYNPPQATLINLPQMTNKLLIPAYAQTGAFFSGWNGPYWTGSLRTVAGVNVPVDGWGNPIQLLYAPTGVPNTWQLASAGPNASMGNADDLFYPSQPVALNTSYMASVSLNIVSNRTVATTSGTVQLQDRWSGVPGVVLRTVYQQPNPPGATVPPNLSGTYTFPGAIPLPVYPGPVTLSISFPAIGAYGPVNYTQVFDLLPGQTQAVNLTLN